MSCAFKGCTNSVHLCKNSGLKFFEFPTLPFIRSKWLEACDVDEQNFPKVPFICSTHFALTDITTTKNKTILCKSAVPQKTRTLFGKNFGNEESLDEYMEYLDGQEDATTSDQYTRTMVESRVKCESLDMYKFKYEDLKKEMSALLAKLSELETNSSLVKSGCKKLEANDHLEMKSSSARYSLDEISLATYIYSAGPRCFRFLRKKEILPLPSPSTLRRWASKLCVEPGLQMQTLSHMKSCDLPIEEKLCVLSFDEMKVREEWSYDRKNDVILPPARMVQVGMVRSLRGGWKQPIFYNFDSKMTETILFQIIHELYIIGYTVVATVSDLGPDNQKLWRSMQITAEEPFFKHPSDESKLVFVFADIPHLMKLLRNHFVDDGFIFNTNSVTENIIEELITLCNSDLTIIKKLSMEMLQVKGASI